MEVRRLSLPPSACWLAPFRPWFDATDPRASGRIDLGTLDAFARARALRLEDGRPVRFVAADAATDVPYELAIARTGCVPTRVSGPGMVHDWFNALCWLRWPAIKARLNRLQADAIVAAPTAGARGPLRDAITLFDESGALFVADDAELVARWRGFDWQALFVEGRGRFDARVRVLIVGHALLEKLLSPYKAICAHALAVEPPVRWPPPRPDSREDAQGEAQPIRAAQAAAEGNDDPGGLDALDRAVAATLGSASLARERLAPLPLLGIPGWWPGNADPAFYNDTLVFRHGRQRRSRR
jgi:hypothetical protein